MAGGPFETGTVSATEVHKWTMWPWGHLALGYLLYAGYQAAVWRRAPHGWAVAALAIGTQFPDLVDKPLAYWFGVLPGGRTFAHSLLVFVPLAFVLLVLAWNYRRTEFGVAFAIGWGSHLVGDSIKSLQRGTYDQLGFLVWPLVPAPDFGATDFRFHALRLISDLRALDFDALTSPGADIFVLQLWLALLVSLLWVAQGMPPLGALGRMLTRTTGRVERG